jgi:alpha-amylase/alpha-mannosidase (GH57 family)
MKRYVCIHGHFYQPPRENAWLETIELQESAAPYHDWNERITAECYAPNAASRILNEDDRIINIVNNYSNISFNFGPTLLSWMERNAPAAYAGILEADARSVKQRKGHGNAIAQVYNHLIMPLASRRDKDTQVKWGLADFKSRFGRDTEGMWLAETAVDTDTLEVLADNGIRFTILAPRQAAATRAVGETAWNEVDEHSVDSTVPYLVNLPSGRTMTVFFYHGALAKAVAFDGLLNSGAVFAGRIVESFNGTDNALVHIATDGESYGHHHRNGDMALASCIDHLQREDLELVNYAQFLSKVSPAHEARIHENSSWSCVHGVERWRSNCGCSDGGLGHGDQQWRQPLREALNWLKELADVIYEKEVGAYCKDPWKLLDNYIHVILKRDKDTAAAILDSCVHPDTGDKEREFIIRLLEMQRNGMLMFTSCAWFFDDISRIEALQVLQYADRVIQIAEGETGKEILQGFLKLLSKAKPNAGNWEDAAEMYLSRIRVNRLDLNSVGMHYAAASLFEAKPEKMQLFNYTYDSSFFERFESASLKISVGNIKVRSRVTFYERPFYFAALYLGQHHIIGHYANEMEEDDFESMYLELRDAFRQNQVNEMTAVMQKYFGDHRFDFEDLFRDQKHKVLSMLMENDLELARISYKKIYDRSYDLVNKMRGVGMSIPRLLRKNMESVINTEIRLFFSEDKGSISRLDYLTDEVLRWKLKIEREVLAKEIGDWLYRQFLTLNTDPFDAEQLDLINKAMLRVHDLEVNPDLFHAQNACFSFCKQYGEVRKVEGWTEEQVVRWKVKLKAVAALLGISI